MEQEINDEQAIATSKIKRDRSAAYAASTLEDSLKFVSEVYKNFRNTFAKRDDIIDLVEGAHNRDIAAASYYLFLNREKDTYQVSQLYKDINNPLSEKERLKCLYKAFEAPKLNKELIDKFDGDEIPKEFVVHLSKFYRITEEAAPLAAEVFIENAKYCGVLNDKNILNFKQAVLKLSDPNSSIVIPAVEVKKDSENEKETPMQGLPELKSQNNLPAQTTPLLLEEMVNKIEEKIRITGRRFIMLVYPDDLNKTDIAILRKEVEKIELRIE